MLNRIIEMYPEEDILKADGFDDAIIGVDYNHTVPRLIYSVSKCLEILKEDMDSEEAIEYFEFNVSGSYMGEKTPIWSWDFF
tara:strand:- start:121 stop:366 length:246 start_codon:yes stop_codon:yes gene_type:complete